MSKELELVDCMAPVALKEPCNTSANGLNKTVRSESALIAKCGIQATVTNQRGRGEVNDFIHSFDRGNPVPPFSFEVEFYAFSRNRIG